MENFEEFKNQLLLKGFDLVQPFRTQAYNEVGPSQLPTFGRDGSLSFLIGNTKLLWSQFSKFVSENGELVLSQGHPLDHYVVSSIEEIARKFPCKYEIRWTTDKDEKFVHFQSLAQISGLAYFNKSCYLCVHKIHGSWIALRAVICLDRDFTLKLSPQPENPFPEGDQRLNELTAKIWDSGKLSHDSAGI
ncbi:hypothetical protein HK096_001877, partial [Nowakowskiella sp. JEL0078]